MGHFYGIDIGTTFITVYHRTAASVSRYRHGGKIADTLRVILKGLQHDDSCVFTGKGGREITESLAGLYVEEAVALSCFLSAGKDIFSGEKGQIIDIGASSLTLYTVKDGKVVDIACNTLCAAGTGLFLEEQAERLQINLEQQGELDINDPPLIASRCTVFAKSDLIHHQQEGRIKDEMWAGLCRSLVISSVSTLFRGEELKDKIMICGGVSLNQEVMRWFRKLHPQVEWITSVGLAHEALIARGASLTQGKHIADLQIDFFHQKKKFQRMPPLTLNRSTFPPMPQPEIDDYHNEIRIHHSLHDVQTIILGMDIGSTSTKLAVLEAGSHTPLFDIYGKTAGDPVWAAKNIFASFYKIIAMSSAEQELSITAFGTTGSGRKLVGEIFGADLIVNEISAHGTGAAHFYPEVETIFEIGGQDAKYIRLQNGYVTDVNMNYVCAAGTGSFVEEQARKLGFDVHEIGAITAGIAPPVTSDRCTVFMEQDLRALLTEGFTKEEALASVLYSVIQNYLNRVVGNRRISGSRIFFQGATARNQGLVAALENLLEVEVTVSPHCHLMGAVGAALRAHDFVEPLHLNKENHLSAFVGREALNMQVVSRTQLCRLCRNNCRINFVTRMSHHNNREFSWGYQCGRDPEENIRKESPQFQLFKERENVFHIKNHIKYHPKAETKEKGTVTLIHALTSHTFLPLWVHFFNDLGYRVVISGRTDASVKKYAAKMASGDFCFPVKVAVGHLAKTLDKQNETASENHVFLPYMIADEPQLKTAHSYFCPYVESSPAIIKSMLNRNGISTKSLLAPVLDLRDSLNVIGENLYESLKERLGVKKKEVLTAFARAYKTWKKTWLRLEKMGTAQLQEAVHTGKPVFLLMGRSYNLHDKGVNLGLPEKIAAMGYTVVPIDMLTLDSADLAVGNYHNIFWKNGQRILAALKMVASFKNVFPIYLSNFNCGPDSCLLTFAEEELSGKPMLILELDEHDSDGGYLTRIEAFLDVVAEYMKAGVPLPREKMPDIFSASRKADTRGTVWIPPIIPSGAIFYAAAFRCYGYDARPLELEDQEALVLGKKHLRGGECLPMTLTLGGFLKKIKHLQDNRRHILFMPTTEGPCRFGQYNLLDRLVFHRMGLTHVDIISPSSTNSYQGFPGGLRRLLMHATMCSDILFKMLTRVRPYERTPGDADELYEKSLRQLEIVLEKGDNPLKGIKKIASRFATIHRVREKKPLVGIVGEIYVRHNAFANGDLVKVIEANGGEAWLTPVHEWLLYVVYMERFASRNRRQNFLKRGGSLVSNYFLFKTERSYYEAAREIMFDRHEPGIKELLEAGSPYLPQAFEGEAILTIGRAILFAQQGANMVVNVAPFGCMPGTLAGSILLEIKDKFKIPFLSLFYDGDIAVNDKVASLIKTINLEK